MPEAPGRTRLPDCAPVAWVALGANLGDAVATLRSARHALSTLSLVEELAASSLYRTRPVDAEGPDFLNAVLAMRTLLGPRELMGALLAIEADHHRRRPFPNAPRTLDLDLLCFHDLVLDTPFLTLPHPRMAGRAFVQCPLAEALGSPVCSGLRHPPAVLPEVQRQVLARSQGIERLPTGW